MSGSDEPGRGVSGVRISPQGQQVLREIHLIRESLSSKLHTEALNPY